jgi:hypothetical protein
VTAVADQQDGPVLARETPGLEVHLRHERAGRVDDRERPPLGVAVHLRCDPVGGQDDDRSLGNLRLLLDEDRPLRLEVADHVQVVDDLPAHVHGRSMALERALDGVHGTLYTRAVAAGRGEEDLGAHTVMVAAPGRPP